MKREAQTAGKRNIVPGLLMLIYVFNFMDRQIMGMLNGFMFALFCTSFGVVMAWLVGQTKRTWVIAGACTV